MKDKFETALDVSVGAFIAAAERAKDVADELAKRGREARDRQKEKAARGAPDGARKRRPTREALAEDLRKILSKMQIATAQDLADLEARISEVERKLKE